MPPNYHRIPLQPNGLYPADLEPSDLTPRDLEDYRDEAQQRLQRLEDTAVDRYENKMKGDE